MGSSDVAKKFRQKLVDSFEELAKPYIQANSNKKEAFQTKSKETYLKAKTNSIDIYENEMNKIFAEFKFLDDDKFEEHHEKSVNKAWANFKSKLTIDGDDVFQKQCQHELYEHFIACYSSNKERNTQNRRCAEKAEEGLVFKVMTEAKDSYTSEMEQYLLNSKCVEEHILMEKHYSAESRALFKVNIL